MSLVADKPELFTDVGILARVLGNEDGDLPLTTARYYLSLEFAEQDRARMHELALRNQEGTLSQVEKEELYAFAKAGSLISILKSRARQALRTKPKKRSSR